VSCPDERCPDERAWYERPPELVRRGGAVVDVKPARLVRLCAAHVRPGDVVVQRGDRGGRTCGFYMSLPPQGGVRVVDRKRGSKR
jgi:hypothetical protein